MQRREKTDASRVLALAQSSRRHSITENIEVATMMVALSFVNGLATRRFVVFFVIYLTFGCEGPQEFGTSKRILRTSTKPAVS